MIDLTSAAMVTWEFEDAPKEYKELSQWGGDEEWVFFVSEHVLGGLPPSHNNWPDLPINIERAVLRITDTEAVEWHELKDGDWIAISYRG